MKIQFVNNINSIPIEIKEYSPFFICSGYFTGDGNNYFIDDISIDLNKGLINIYCTISSIKRI
jgi:hypothetical protein